MEKPNLHANTHNSSNQFTFDIQQLKGFVTQERRGSSSSSKLKEKTSEEQKSSESGEEMSQTPPINQTTRASLSGYSPPLPKN
jgi:hypothetical protein